MSSDYEKQRLMFRKKTLLKEFLAARKVNLFYCFFTKFIHFLAARSCSRFSPFLKMVSFLKRDQECERLRDHKKGVQVVRDPATASVDASRRVQIYRARVKAQCCAFEGADLLGWLP